jgi:hypothetical protein
MPKFDGPTSWPVFQWQFETMGKHNGCAPGDKTAHLIPALNEPTTFILHSVPTEAMYKGVAAVLENHYSDHLAKAFHAQLRRDQHTRESLQEFVATIDHLVHCVYVDSTEKHISREAARVFANGARERDQGTAWDERS